MRYVWAAVAVLLMIALAVAPFLAKRLVRAAIRDATTPDVVEPYPQDTIDLFAAHEFKEAESPFCTAVRMTAARTLGREYGVYHVSPYQAPAMTEQFLPALLGEAGLVQQGEWRDFMGMGKVTSFQYDLGAKHRPGYRYWLFLDKDRWYPKACLVTGKLQDG